jgi:hypothetical protein
MRVRAFSRAAASAAKEGLDGGRPGDQGRDSNRRIRLRRFRADVGVWHGHIAAIGHIRERAREIDGKPTGAPPGLRLRGALAWRV